MHRTLCYLLAFCGIAACVANGAAKSEAKSPASIPVENFFAAPDVRSLQISPGGKYLAFLTPLGTGTVGIALMDLATGKVEPLLGPRDDNVDFYFWKSDDRLVFGGDVKGNESDALRSVSVSKRKIISISGSMQRENIAFKVGSLISRLDSYPDHIVLYGNASEHSWTFGYWKADLRTGDRVYMGDAEDNELPGASMVGSSGAVLARQRNNNGTMSVETRTNGLAIFRKVTEFSDVYPAWSMLNIASDDNTLYLLTTDKSDTSELHALNLTTGELGPTLFHAPDEEIVRIIMSRDNSRLLGVITEGDKYHYRWLDPEWAGIQAKIDAALPKTLNRIIDTTLDEKQIVIFASSDTDPGTYYLLDLRVPRIMQIGKARAKIDPTLMRPMEPVQFAARDGLVIHGYLTRPAAHADSPGPLIVLPHGGPYGIRDSWGFDPEAQFFASRGYAVFQINFRGSGGYGGKFQRAGAHEWGGKMQDDLTDGVKWAVAQRIADPDRVAIYGASYGGYAALAGVTFTPDLYKCAINYVGVSDIALLEQHKWIGDTTTNDFYRDWIGNDRDFLRDRSPVNFVDRIKVPTLHIYGFNDPRVDIEHWKRLRSKLEQFHKTFEYVVEKNEGHGIDREATRIEAYKRMETFLQKYMPAGK